MYVSRYGRQNMFQEACADMGATIQVAKDPSQWNFIKEFAFEHRKN